MSDPVGSFELLMLLVRSANRAASASANADTAERLEALFVVAITLGLRPGELRALTWNHVHLD
jgi:integrase